MLSNSPEGIAIYLSAMWCQPCIAKTRLISDYFNQNKSIKQIFVYDPGFTDKKAKKILGDLYNKETSFLIPKSFYGKRKILMVNPQDNSLKVIADSLSKFKVIKGSLFDLWFGELIYIDNKRRISVLNFENKEQASPEGISAFLKQANTL